MGHAHAVIHTSPPPPLPPFSFRGSSESDGLRRPSSDLNFRRPAPQPEAAGGGRGGGGKGEPHSFAPPLAYDFGLDVHDLLFFFTSLYACAADGA